jgi:hypothetical protein
MQYRAAHWMGWVVLKGIKLQVNGTLEHLIALVDVMDTYVKTFVYKSCM